MSLYPGAVHKLLPESDTESDTQPRITPRAIIHHSAGGKGSLYGWWQNPQSNGLECHFWIGDDGTVEQYMDTNVRADANGEANGFAISIETESTVHASEPWTAAQVEAIVALDDWLCRVHQIPRRLMTSPTGSGLAWHVQFGAPGPWTRARGKVCPGPARIAQMTDEIVPRVQARLTTPAPKPPTGGFLMALTDDEQRELLAKTRKIDAAIAAGVKLHPKDVTRQRVLHIWETIRGIGTAAGMYRRQIAAAVREVRDETKP